MNNKKQDFNKMQNPFDLDANLNNILCKNFGVVEPLQNNETSISKEIPLNVIIDNQNKVGSNYKNLLVNKKPSISSLNNKKSEIERLNLDNLNDINKKYHLFEDIALEKIYEDIQNDMKSKFSDEKKNFNSKNKDFANYSTPFHMKKKEDEKLNPKISKNADDKNRKSRNNLIKQNSFQIINPKSNSNKAYEEIINGKNFINTSENDLFLSMTKRLNVVEAQLKENKILLEKKNLENKDLREKLEELQNKIESYKTINLESNGEVSKNKKSAKKIGDLMFINDKILIDKEIGFNEDDMRISQDFNIYSKPKIQKNIMSNCKI